jgi:hypothetical protein
MHEIVLVPFTARKYVSGARQWLRPRFDPSTDAWIVTGQGGEVVAAAYTWDEEPRTVFDSAGVDRDNAFGATHLYERAGMRLRRRWLVVAKTLDAAPDPPS